MNRFLRPDGESGIAALPMRYSIHVPDADLVDLHGRLSSTRFPESQPEGRRWQYGTPVDYLKTVVEHWRDGYDWRLWETRLNRFSHHLAAVGDQTIHLLVEPGSGQHPFPLVLTHGWPGSFVEFLDMIDPLAHPERHGGRVEDAFTVIVPSLPGFGFSGAPSAPLHPRAVAGLWRSLMVETLGYPRYGAQGGDWGAAVTSWLALDHPREIGAIHLNMASLQPWLGEGSPDLDDEERAWRDTALRRRQGEIAYQQIQGTKPQTLAYGLTDSPAGLAAWILEKFHGWTVGERDVDPPFSLDHLLTNVMIYWLNGINAANWMYCSTVAGTSKQLAAGEHVSVPTAMLLFENDIAVPPPDAWLRRCYNLVRRRTLAGGHFAPMENGAELVNDLRAFYRAYR